MRLTNCVELLQKRAFGFRKHVVKGHPQRPQDDKALGMPAGLIIFSLRAGYEKAIVWLLIIFPTAIPTICFAQTENELEAKRESYAQGIQAGKLKASEIYSPIGWSVGGFACGFAFNVFGTGAVVLVTRVVKELPPKSELFQLESFPSEYQDGFLQGYNQRAKAKATGTALMWGLIGTATIFALFVASPKVE